MDWFLDVRALPRGGPIGSLHFNNGSSLLSTPAPLLAEAAGRHVVLMAHGYNVDRKDGIAALTYFKRHFQAVAGDDVFFLGILWPGDCILPIFIDYIWEGNEAETAGKMVAAFVQQQLAPIAATVSFFSHSLGARVVLNAVGCLQDPVCPRHVILLAGAIEDNTLLQEFNVAANRAQKITVVFSLEDEVLKLAYPSGNLIGGILERDDANVIPALGRYGPSAPWNGKITVNPKLPDTWDYGHTDYLTAKQPPEDATGVEFFLDPADATKIPIQTAACAPSSVPTVLQRNRLWKPAWSPVFSGNRWLNPD